MRGAQIDPLLCLFTTLSLYALLRHLLLGPAWGWYTLGGFVAGLGVITKGVGFLPMLVLIPFFLLRAFRWKNLATIDGGRLGWRWWFAPLALVSSYGCAWVGHFGFEKNKPAAFEHPFWSLLCDFRMYGKMIAGTMGAEIERATRIATA